MTKPKIDNIARLERKLQKATNSYQKAIDNIAKVARLEVVKPFCDQYNLEFITGQAGWTFRAPYGHVWFDHTANFELSLSQNAEPAEVEKLPQYMPQDLRDVLYAETLAGDLGTHMDDYTPEGFTLNTNT